MAAGRASQGMSQRQAAENSPLSINLGAIQGEITEIRRERLRGRGKIGGGHEKPRAAACGTGLGNASEGKRAGSLPPEAAIGSATQSLSFSFSMPETISTVRPSSSMAWSMSRRCFTSTSICPWKRDSATLSWVT